VFGWLKKQFELVGSEHFFDTAALIKIIFRKRRPYPFALHPEPVEGSKGGTDTCQQYKAFMVRPFVKLRTHHGAPLFRGCKKMLQVLVQLVVVNLPC
jgi:hypothetical protein